MIYFIKQPEAHNGKDRSTRVNAATEKRTMASWKDGQSLSDIGRALGKQAASVLEFCWLRAG